MRFARRTLLRGLTGGAALAPFLPLLAEDVEAAAPRRRLVVMFTPDSPLAKTWDATPGARPTDFTLGPAMEALRPFQKQLVLVKGLDKTPGRYDKSGPGSPHTKAISCAFTAAPMTPGTFDDFGAGGAKIIGWVDAVSVDQRIASAIAPKARTPFRSLVLGAINGTHNPARRISYQAPGQAVDPEQDPYVAFKRIFASRPGIGGADIERLRRERRSTLDAVGRDLAAFAARVGREDQQRIEAHLQAVREVEKRLQPGPPRASCHVNLPDGRLDPAADVNYPAVIDLHVDLIDLAFACDLTRVVSLQLSRSGGRIVHSWLGHTQEAHEDGHAAGASDPARQRQDQRARFYVGRFARLLEKLQARKEGGRSILDSSVIAWNWELSGRPDGHQTMDTPWVLAGSCGGRIATGRLLQFQHHPHSPLLVSLCHAMGLHDVQTFGRSEVIVAGNRTVKAVGPLPGLMA